MGAHVLAFAGVSVLLIVMPGPDTALVTRNALWGGRRAALASSLGITLGLAVWTLAAALGVASLLRASSIAFDALRYAGAVYLVMLGVQTLWRSRGTESADVQAGRGARGRAAFRQGLLSDLSNPKIAVFFTSFLPQFVSRDHALLPQTLLLGAIFVGIGGVWLVVFSWLVARVGDVLRRPRVRRGLERFTGAVFVAFGLRLAVERG
jgi:RhtB (resistance to homoserine/threonine) family protein